MLHHNPDLVEHHERDPQNFNAMFSALRTMNPAFSKEPIVAGTYMRQMVNSPVNAGEFAVRALGERSNLPDHFRNTASDALKTQFNPSQYDPTRRAMDEEQLKDLQGRNSLRGAQEARANAQEARANAQEARANAQERRAEEKHQRDMAASASPITFAGGSPVLAVGSRKTGPVGTPSPRPARLRLPLPGNNPGLGGGFIGGFNPLC